MRVKYVIYFDADCKCACVYVYENENLTLKRIQGAEESPLQLYCRHNELSFTSYIKLDNIEEIVKSLKYFRPVLVVVGSVRCEEEVLPTCKSRNVVFIRKENDQMDVETISAKVEALYKLNPLFSSST